MAATIHIIDTILSSPLAKWILMMMRNRIGVDAGKERREILFAKATDEYSGVITRICRSFAGKESYFEDLVQDSYLNIWNGIDRFRGDSELKTWVYRVTLNTCVATYRKSRNRVSEIDIEQVRGVAAANDNSFENSQWMNSLLSVLTPLDHSVMSLWLDDLSYEEIAEVMGMNRNTVATRIRRSKEKLSKHITL